MTPKTADEVKAFCLLLEQRMLAALAEGRFVYMNIGPVLAREASYPDMPPPQVGTEFVVHIGGANSPPPASADNSSPS